MGDAGSGVSPHYLPAVVRSNSFTTRTMGMRRQFSSIALLGSALLVGGQRLGAQASPGQTMPFPVFGLGGGISVPVGGVAKDRLPGFNLVGLAEFRTPSEPLGIRAEALYQYFGAKENSAGVENSNTFAALINVVYHAPQSQVRPYVIGGMGLYHISDHGNNAGLNAGAGVTIPLANMGAYAEVRVHTALTQGPSYVTVPITFGLTF